MDMHEILKMALKELEATANPEDVAAYIKACVDKQAAIDGSAAKEEKAAEKADAEIEEMAATPDEVPPPPAEDLPPEVPAAMSAAAPPAAPAAAPAAMAETTPEAAGSAQLESVLASAGTTLAALLARISEDPSGFMAWIGGTAGTTDGLPPSVNVPLTADYEGTSGLSALKKDHEAATLKMSALEGHLTARDETIAALTAKVAALEAVEKKTDADRAKEAEASKRAEFAAKVDEAVKFSRLIFPRDVDVAKTRREAWISMGMTQPERFTEMLASLPPGVPTEIISAKSTGTEHRLSAPGQDGDDAHLGEAFRLAHVQYLATGMNDKDAKAAARKTALGANGTPTTKLTGAA